MSKFISTLKTEQIGRVRRNLLDKLVFEDSDKGIITVPSGYSTDFASIKVMHNIVLFPLFALLSGYGNYAATVHDYLYETRMFDRKTCDDVFYRALRAEGIAKWRAWIFWAGVRLGGRKAYDN